MTEIQGVLFELVDDEELEARDARVGKDGVLSLALSGTALVVSTILLSKGKALFLSLTVPRQRLLQASECVRAQKPRSRAKRSPQLFWLHGASRAELRKLSLTPS